MEFGGIYVNEGATAIGGIATGGYTTVTNFTTAMGYNQVFPRPGADNLEALHRELFYFSFAQVSFIGQANQEYRFALLKDGIDTGFHAHQGNGASGTYNSISVAGFVELGPNDLLSLGVANAGGLTGTTITIKAAQLMAARTDVQE
jgi:hypothetical protein